MRAHIIRVRTVCFTALRMAAIDRGNRKFAKLRAPIDVAAKDKVLTVDQLTVVLLNVSFYRTCKFTSFLGKILKF